MWNWNGVAWCYTKSISPSPPSAAATGPQPPVPADPAGGPYFVNKTIGSIQYQWQWYYDFMFPTQQQWALVQNP